MAPHLYQAEEQRPIYDIDNEYITNRNNKKNAFIISGFILGVVSLVTLGGHLAKNYTNNKVDLHPKPFVKTPPSCSTIECYSTNCDKQLAPFLCTKGNAFGGCSNEASAWVDDKICTKSCDLRDCDLHAVVEDEASLPRHCNECNKEQCDFLAKQFFQSCGNDAPYTCLKGANLYGCSSNKYVWEAAVETTCGECCDKRSCDK